MLGGLASFCVLAVGARELSGELSIAQSLCIRSAIGIIFLSLLYIVNQRVLGSSNIIGKPKNTLEPTAISPPWLKGLKLKGIRLQVFRNVFHFTAQYGWFFGIGLLPLAEVFALEFTVPIWTLLISALFLGEKVTPTKFIAILFGSIGVLIIVQPGDDIMSLASFVVLGSAICFAVSHTAIKALSRAYSPFSILCYMCVLQFPIGLVLSINHWIWPQPEQWIWLVIIGLGALSAHFCVTKAMLHAEVTTVVTLDFLRLPLITFIGVIFYAESFELSLLIGAALMLAGNLLNTSNLKHRINLKVTSYFQSQ
jgi:drug/metabolite transporter (DMT)-like permease